MKRISTRSSARPSPTQDVPFLVGMVGDAGGVIWSGAAGERSPGQAATVDTVFRIFSMTKAVGSTAAMILIDRGKLERRHGRRNHPARVRRAEGAGRLRRRAPEAARTAHQGDRAASGDAHVGPGLRVLEHRSAALHGGYRCASRSSRGWPLRSSYPLQFEPGERWDYGIGIDWLGRIVEKVDGRSIDRFCKEEIFDPLKMGDTRFEVEDHMKAPARGGEDPRRGRASSATSTSRRRRSPSSTAWATPSIRRRPTTCASCGCT